MDATMPVATAPDAAFDEANPDNINAFVIMENNDHAIPAALREAARVYLSNENVGLGADYIQGMRSCIQIK